MGRLMLTFAKEILAETVKLGGELVPIPQAEKETSLAAYNFGAISHLVLGGLKAIFDSIALYTTPSRVTKFPIL